MLRNHPRDLFLGLGGNKYETTTFRITGSIVILPRLLNIILNRRHYRGLGGMILAEYFLKEKGGFSGGVEWGLTFTATNKGVSIEYS